MSSHGKPTRTRNDTITADVVRLLRARGFSVLYMNKADRKGVPDLLIARRNRNYLIEVKSGKRGKVSDEQIEFAEKWHAPVHLVRDFNDVLELIDQITMAEALKRGAV